MTFDVGTIVVLGLSSAFVGFIVVAEVRNRLSRRKRLEPRTAPQDLSDEASRRPSDVR